MILCKAGSKSEKDEHLCPEMVRRKSAWGRANAFDQPLSIHRRASRSHRKFTEARQYSVIDSLKFSDLESSH